MDDNLNPVANVLDEYDNDDDVDGNNDASMVMTL